MDKSFFMIRLVPPRPDFAQTMTTHERDIMQRHAAYWAIHMERGLVHVFGPVLHPKGVFGLGIVSVASEEELKSFIDHDPSLEFNTIEYYPMLATIAGS